MFEKVRERTNLKSKLVLEGKSMEQLEDELKMCKTLGVEENVKK